MTFIPGFLTKTSSVQRSVQRFEGRLHHNLGQGGVGMDGIGQVLDIAAKLHGQGSFGNQIGGMGANNMNPQYLSAVGMTLNNALER